MRATTPIGKTNMMIESHWKVLKHCYLHRFNRPRLDYLVWIIYSRVLPDQTTHFQQISLGRATPKWFDEFKKSWNQLATKPIADSVEERYAINLDYWLCSCPSFLRSRFLICKHLIHRAIEKVNEPKEILTPNLDLQLQSSMTFSADGDDENANPELYQQCEVKVVALEYLSNHLREELSLNNIRHVRNVVNNMDQVFTIINDIKSSQLNLKRGNTWSAKT
ncbi:13948_t:CDS:2, partial [Gigaspora margarita]